MRSRIVAFTMLGYVASSAAVAAPADEAAIRANVSAYETAWNKRDASGVVATYTPDADVVIFDSPRAAGHEAIRKTLEAGFATTPASTRITLSVTSIRQLSQDVAIAETLAKFNEGAVRENRGTSVLVRHGGRWLVTALRVYPAQRP
jgi:uncharacterized protein (TIGR02246 family)